MKKVIKRLGQAIGIGSTICMLFAFIFADNDVRKIVASFVLLSVVIGLLGMVYSVKRLPMLAQTLIHMGGSFIAFLITAGVNDWFPFKWQVIVSASLSFFLIFFAIWIFYYLKYKRDIQQINQKLR
ncbi:DUF3021 domain-containing protein [Enterococcus malodoratus]|uniref:DUF3021 domain-containing protein n=1 Tax=Enterococcus malodoratus ATCC 43197 TaxID=1158601 RepID=R2R625_9ENTE|nr:DUF3021 domain-containing protein [Enterococcus malodoratus]EOH79055.1 hypothetical protein UAI_01701 [Enterococcus malodoratus ATCC 43197]EOT64520.1 hypothetical protein I585_03720 [Enterococcus malodoratus ATCC 43197]SPW92724.1 Protein of uncharacterised function (DUF3021) [Enterococcus malodoratus]STC72823.1 Protein of uncharacterised function (DUF3021) [Enterococcus malodoratus]